MNALMLVGRSVGVQHRTWERKATADRPASTGEEYLLTVATDHGLVQCVCPPELMSSLGDDMEKLDNFGQLVQAIVEPGLRFENGSRVGCVKALDIEVPVENTNDLQPA